MTKRSPLLREACGCDIAVERIEELIELAGKVMVSPQLGSTWELPAQRWLPGYVTILIPYVALDPR